MTHPKALLALAMLLGAAPLLFGQPPGGDRPKALPPKQVEKSILLKVQVLRLPEAKLKENNGGKMPPKVFVVPASPLSVANLVKLGAKVIVEPSLVTTDGRVATFEKGVEIPVTDAGDNAAKVDWLTFGMKADFHPRILADGKISLKFRFQQTVRAEDPVRDAAISALSGAVLTSGRVSEGIATLNVGESVFATIPDQENAGEMLIMFFTPEITGEITADSSQVQPASVTTPMDASPFPIEDTTSKPARMTLFKSADRMPQSAPRADMVLEVSETGYLDCPETIREAIIQGGSKRIIDVKALGNSKLSVQGIQVGKATVVVVDKNGEEYAALVEVKPAKGAGAVQDTLRRLFPDAQIEATAINESLLLRGSVTNEEHLKQIAEIAEQYAPTVLNHLVVDDGLSATNYFGLPPGMRFQTLRALLLDETEAGKPGEKESSHVEGDVEMEWTELVEGKSIKSFKPLLKGVAVVRVERQHDYPYYPSGSPEPAPEAKEPDENPFAQVVLVLTPDQAGVLKLAARSAPLRVRLRKPGVIPIPVGTIVRETEARLRDALPEAQPSARLPVISAGPKVDDAQESTEIQELRSDVKALRQDVKRLIEILERKSSKTPASLEPYYSPAEPPKPARSVPSFVDPTEPANTAPLLPAPIQAPKGYRPPSKTLPSPAYLDPVKPAPAIPADGFNPYAPSPVYDPSGLVSPPPKAASAKPAPVRIETKPLPDSLDPSAFVTVRTAKISGPEHLGNPVPASLGSGVVIESELGKAVILTAAHLLREYEAGKYVLQVGAGQIIEEDGKTRRVSGSYPATIILQDDKADIALLRAKVPVKLATISLARHSLPKRQDAIYCIGFPKDGKHSPKSVAAKVTAVNRLNGSENFDFAGFIPDGFSGGAVLDESRQLIGIALALNLEIHQTVCTPAAEIRKLLASDH